MLKRTITFDDLNGEKLTEDHYFHLNKAEIAHLITTDEGYTLDKLIERLAVEKKQKKIMEIFDQFLEMTYGRPSPDGRKFEKSPEIWKDFKDTEAYSIIFMELISDAKKAADFVNAVVPQDIADEIRKIVRDNPDGIPDELKEYVVDNPADIQVLK